MRKKYIYQTNFEKGWNEGFIDVTHIASYEGDLGIEIGKLKLTLPLPTRIELYKHLIREDQGVLFDAIEDQDYLIFPDMDEVVRAAKEVE